MNIPKDNFKFYYKEQLIVSVKLPIGCKPTVYMKCGTDNRPYDVIVADIRLAIGLLEDEFPRGFTRDISIAWGLPRLLGYTRCNANLE